MFEKDEIFVFGSNLAGKHLGGAAKAAHNKFGAQWGVGVGLTGQAYAIPTMQGGVETIKPYVDEFIEFAQEHQEMKFLVTCIGCGIAGFKAEEIAPLFKQAIAVCNIYLPKECNRRVDDMIVLLLGSTFKRTFTERELIEHYNYPTATDDELLDWQTDNL